MPDDLVRGVEMPERTCSVDGCDERARARGWCNTHYRRWERTGTTDRHRIRAVDQNGYVRIYCPGHPAADARGYALEHRKVLIDAAVDLTGLVVHHRNGDRQDNHFENLE